MRGRLATRGNIPVMNLQTFPGDFLLKFRPDLGPADSASDHFLNGRICRSARPGAPPRWERRLPTQNPQAGSSSRRRDFAYQFGARRDRTCTDDSEKRMDRLLSLIQGI
jgi:hypothetical protein